MYAKQEADGEMQTNRMAACLPKHALGQSGCAAGVDNVDTVRGSDGDAGSLDTLGFGAARQRLPVPFAIEAL